MKTAALYLRSSKDRSDVSIDAQRRELLTLAASKNIIVTQEYIDVVESGKDEFRPGFQLMFTAMRRRDCAWSIILVLDTSRIGRRRYIAQLLAQECKKANVTIMFAKLPETDPISDVILHAVFEAMDEVHSLLSRQKGLAGMAENIEQGFRAGGRAPFGYQLKHIGTGAVRDGAAVTKSRLVPNSDAPKAAAYLNGRAAGRSANPLAAQIGLAQTPSSLNSIEWNALTYAGHTVWNMHNAQTRSQDGDRVRLRYAGGTKRRPRSEWTIKRNTHAALIDDAAAEAILARLETKKQTRRTNSHGGTYLLSGVLVTPDGLRWHGDSGYYRAGKGKKISAAAIEKAVVSKLIADLTGDAFVARLTKQVKALVAPVVDGTALQQQARNIERIERQINRLTTLLADTDTPAPLMRKIEQLEAQRTEAARQRDDQADALQQQRAAVEITEAAVKQCLGKIAENLQEANRGHVKDFVAGLVDKIQLNSNTTTCCIHYKFVDTTGELMASPRRSVSIPPLIIRRKFIIRRDHRGRINF